MGKKLDLKHPKTLIFNEKIQWLKLYNRKPEYTQMADKCAARKWICRELSERGYEYPDSFLPAVYGKWDCFDAIDFSNLPDSFVLKTNHDSGTVVLVPDKSKFDAKAARKKLTKSLAINYYKHGREYVYRDIKPCVFAEEYLGYNINDYKFFCFDGKVRAIEVDFDRLIEHKRNVYTSDWNFVPLQIRYPNDPNHIIPRPEVLSEMIKIAEILSQGLPFLRVDLYNVLGRIYIGELTFYPASGCSLFYPDSYNEIFGGWIKLPDTKTL
ncbi:MAG: hypothetical protein LBJ36_10655 [Synergistaceae bacterium]|nr:hypothetical protein [Synergistaceae bacterium]